MVNAYKHFWKLTECTPAKVKPNVNLETLGDHEVSVHGLHGTYYFEWDVATCEGKGDAGTLFWTFHSILLCS
jgi:hypothetical protein